MGLTIIKNWDLLFVSKFTFLSFLVTRSVSSRFLTVCRGDMTRPDLMHPCQQIACHNACKTGSGDVSSITNILRCGPYFTRLGAHRLDRKSRIATRMGFEPTRAEPNGLAVHRLNHSATSSSASNGLPNICLLRGADDLEKPIWI